MVTQTDWLDEGLRVLAVDGAAALTIERLAAALSLSKGSFYHHFAGMPAFRTALLAHYEAMFTTRYIEAVDRQDHTSTAARLRYLLDLVLAGHVTNNPEHAFRAWATQDPEARAAMSRVDAIRSGYLRDQWLAMTGDADEAATVGTLLYLTLLGAQQIIPGVPAEQLHRMYDLLLRRLPPDGAVVTPPAQSDDERDQPMS